jgi:aminopeptidase N
LIDWEYHANSEFFSNFASYDVALELPPGFAVGSTGNLKLVDRSDTIAVWHAEEKQVIDFAFACGPDFEMLESDTLGIRIHYLLKNENIELLDRIERITEYSLAYCSEELFKYPYRNFTVVDFGPGAAGLELPGLISVAIPESKSENALDYLEHTIAHETAHQWFYATIATNEFEEPWLDEGLTSYLTSKIAGSYGDGKSFIGLYGYNISLDELSRTFALIGKTSYPINLKSWEYPGSIDYNSAVYSRALLVLQTLEGITGDSVFASALKDFAEDYRFGHPDGKDFLSSISSSTGLDLTYFSSQFVNGIARVDYGVTSLKYDEVPGESHGEAVKYKITVDVRRKLDGIIPQKITVGLDDGATIDTTWDGRAGVASFEFMADSKPRYAGIDEDNISPLDENRTNDRIYLDSHSLQLISFEWDAVFTLEFMLSLFL